jgi:hypothetical protein
MNLVPVVSVVSILGLVGRGTSRASAGHGGLTHIIILFFIVELAAAGDGRYLGRGRRSAALILIVCQIC